jgi:hypothetical protein
MFRQPPALTSRFLLDGRNGLIKVYFGVNPGPQESGYDVLDFDESTLAVVKGFPSVKAEVDLAANGYWNLLGWVQLVTSGRPGGRSRTIVDSLPAFAQAKLPFVVSGYRPVLYDSPVILPPSPTSWRARSYLTVVPRLSRREEIRALTGFSWGYDISSLGGEIMTRSPQALSSTAWEEDLRILRRKRWRWRFGPFLSS